MDRQKAQFLQAVGRSDFAREAEEHFFAAMRQGYAADCVKGSLPDLPGSKSIEYTHDDWRVLDVYFVTVDSNWSAGSTTIWFMNRPVWIMQYAGWYEEAALPCLKAALADAYTRGDYVGGRGPEYFDYDSHARYWNKVAKNCFTGLTQGEEEVESADGQSLGRHFYHAFWLVRR
ncbi:MAG: hypothetical protein AAB388_03705 [Patescibacteria group bacterium]